MSLALHPGKQYIGRCFRCDLRTGLSVTTKTNSIPCPKCGKPLIVYALEDKAPIIL